MLVMIISSEVKCMGLGKYQSYHERDQLPSFRPNWQLLINFEFAQSHFALQRSETDSPNLEFVHSPILLHNPIIIHLAQFQIRESKTGENIPVYSISVAVYPV